MWGRERERFYFKTVSLSERRNMTFMQYLQRIVPGVVLWCAEYSFQRSTHGPHSPQRAYTLKSQVKTEEGKWYVI